MAIHWSCILDLVAAFSFTHSQKALVPLLQTCRPFGPWLTKVLDHVDNTLRVAEGCHGAWAVGNSQVTFYVRTGRRARRAVRRGVPQAIGWIQLEVALEGAEMKSKLNPGAPDFVPPPFHVIGGFLVLNGLPQVAMLHLWICRSWPSWAFSRKKCWPHCRFRRLSFGCRARFVSTKRSTAISRSKKWKGSWNSRALESVDDQLSLRNFSFMF